MVELLDKLKKIFPPARGNFLMMLVTFFYFSLYSISLFFSNSLIFIPFIIFISILIFLPVTIVIYKSFLKGLGVFFGIFLVEFLILLIFWSNLYSIGGEGLGYFLIAVFFLSPFFLAFVASGFFMRFFFRIKSILVRILLLVLPLILFYGYFIFEYFFSKPVPFVVR